MRPTPLPTPPGWQPPALNGGWTYRNRVDNAGEGQRVCDFYAERYPHSGPETWLRRLAEGEIRRHDLPIQADAVLARGDRLAWHRPPWQEEAVPGRWECLFDDGDLLALDKPSGLPVMPAGGFLEHTLLRLLERRHANDPAGIPRPVHRLGRFTSGLLLCARRPASRAWLSARLRESTARLEDSRPANRGNAGAGSVPVDQPHGCRKLYRALISPAALGLRIGETLTLTTPIARQSHLRLGSLWAAGSPDDAAALAARSDLTLLEQRSDADLVEVAIRSGRPHQIRIHCAAAGAPLLGDPLYRPGGHANPEALPGDGGYGLHARRVEVPRPEGPCLILATSAAPGLWWAREEEREEP
jgi:23S rRNA pseudouridine1911/1915/1917 synthase